MKEGAEMDCPLQTGHLCFLKCVLGVKRTTCNWTADRALSSIPGVKCRTAEVLTAFGGLQRSLNLRTRLCRVWNGLDSVGPRDHNHKQITYHRWFASPLNSVSAEADPYKAPRFLNSVFKSKLGRHVQRNISRFRLRTHKMEEESLLAVWLFALWNKYAHLFFETSPQTRVSLGPPNFNYSEAGRDQQAEQ
eukprot:404427-Pelagomonas_calceolata.AAC.2